MLKRAAPFVLLFVLTTLANAQRNSEVRVPGGAFTMGTNEGRVDRFRNLPIYQSANLPMVHS